MAPLPEWYCWYRAYWHVIQVIFLASVLTATSKISPLIIWHLYWRIRTNGNGPFWQEQFAPGCLGPIPTRLLHCYYSTLGPRTIFARETTITEVSVFPLCRYTYTDELFMSVEPPFFLCGDLNMILIYESIETLMSTSITSVSRSFN